MRLRSRESIRDMGRPVVASEHVIAPRDMAELELFGHKKHEGNIIGIKEISSSREIGKETKDAIDNENNIRIDTFAHTYKAYKKIRRRRVKARRQQSTIKIVDNEIEVLLKKHNIDERERNKVLNMRMDLETATWYLNKVLIPKKEKKSPLKEKKQKKTFSINNEKIKMIEEYSRQWGISQGEALNRLLDIAADKYFRKNIYDDLKEKLS